MSHSNCTGHKKGEYQFVDPHDDLNMSQSD